MFPKSIKYFQNISLPYVEGIRRELSFLCRKKNTRAAPFWKQYARKGLDAALSTIKQ